MYKKILLFLCIFFASMLHASASAPLDTQPVDSAPFLSVPSHNLLLGGGSGALSFGLASIAHRYYREMRRLENMVALALLSKDHAQTDVDHEIAEQRLNTLIRQRNRAKNTMLYLGIPAGFFGATALALTGHGMMLLS